MVTVPAHNFFAPTRAKLIAALRCLPGGRWSVWLDKSAAGAAGAVAQRGWNDQGALAADFHGGDPFVPAGDHPALPDRKLERFIAVDRRVEFLAFLAALIKPAGVMHDADLTGLRCRAGADRVVDDLQA